MATQAATTLAAQPVFMFMPDITGFTQFVTSTEIAHAQEIIQDLLEIIIQSNQLNLEVSEIEGDAVFFYRTGQPPNFKELMQQVQEMFTRFHQHLHFFYVQQRICPCGACSSASQLKLKFFAHYGEVSGIAVQQQRKLFGKEVIVIRRLMKNNLDKKEYLLLTHPLLQGVPESLPCPDWYLPEEALELYDVGEVRFRVSDLHLLRSRVPPMKLPVHEWYKNAVTSFSEEREIEAPMGDVFTAIFDLSKRPGWMDGVKSVEVLTRGAVNRVGTKHRCVLGGKNDPVIVTEKIEVGTEKIELVEMAENGMGGCCYVLQKTNDDKTNIRVDVLVKNTLLVKTVFNVLMKGRMKKRISRSLDNLQRYCTGAIKGQVQEPALLKEHQHD